MKTNTEKKIEKVEKIAQVVGDVANIGLCVISPFRCFKRGDLIHDAAEIKQILGCHEQHMVNQFSR